MRWKYAKLLQNVNNVVQAVCGTEVQSPELGRRLRDESLACFAAAGIEPVPPDEFRARTTSYRLPGGTVPRPRSTSNSTWQSLARGAGSVEVDYLNGEVSLLGRTHGVPTPANDAMAALTHRLARAGLVPGSVSLDEVWQEIAWREGAAAGTGKA